jgi:multidrug efflux pump subunit AcrB
MQDSEKEFKPTSWAIDNRVAIYVATVAITIFGMITYLRLPKENFPEVVFPMIYVSTQYRGAPTDVENLISKEIEKEVKSIEGVKKVTSNSFQNFSNVIVEFETDVNVSEAKIEVKDAVDRAKRNLPTDMDQDPSVIDIDISEVPIMQVNLWAITTFSCLSNMPSNCRTVSSQCLRSAVPTLSARLTANFRSTSTYTRQGSPV